MSGEIDPVGKVQRMGSFQGVPAYGCLLTTKSEHRLGVGDPLYGQTELDAAVAAERERWTSAIASALATRDRYGWSPEVDEALEGLRSMCEPNVRSQAGP